jgi:hypothetical protein
MFWVNIMCRAYMWTYMKHCFLLVFFSIARVDVDIVFHF